MKKDEPNGKKQDNSCLIAIIIILVVLVFGLWGSKSAVETDSEKAQRMCSELVVEKGTNDGTTNGKMYDDCMIRFGYDPAKYNSK